MPEVMLDYPDYLKHKLERYERRYCQQCGALLPVRYHRNHRAAPTNNRKEFILESRTLYGRKKFCSNQCSYAHNPPRGPRKRAKAAPAPWAPPERRRVATAFSTVPVSKSSPPPATQAQINALLDTIEVHPELGLALLVEMHPAEAQARGWTYHDAWVPWSSAITSPNRRSTRT